VIGARGQVGSEVVRAATADGHQALQLNREDCDVTSAGQVRRALEACAPLDVVVNTAAYHRVDECESHPDRAVGVNARGAHHVTIAARAVGARTVYISTDYVFDGRAKQPYVETDAVAPLNVYGASKAAGEAITCFVSPQGCVARIAAVFGPAGSSAKGGNFVERMVATARAGQAPRVIDDIVMSPTSAADAAALLVKLLAGSAEPGVYHLANSGQCSWREFADAIFELCDLPVRAEPIRAAESQGPARPAYSALSSAALATYGLAARPWKEALADYLTSRGYRSQS